MTAEDRDPPHIRPDDSTLQAERRAEHFSRNDCTDSRTIGHGSTPISAKITAEPAGTVSKVPMQTFNTFEVEKLLDTFAVDRLGHVWHLALVGLRRGELCGLRWTEIDFEAQTISIQVTRVVVDGQVVEGDTKSETSTCVLPLTQGAAGGTQGRRAHAGRGAVRRRTHTYERSGYVVRRPSGAALPPRHGV
jgi:integrase